MRTPSLSKAKFFETSVVVAVSRGGPTSTSTPPIQ
jgi:hypothetical protein